MIGHNDGPTLESGHRWRRHCWKKARRDLLPNLPIEILRTRVKRAKELGLEYKVYASVRASTGRDVIGFLFSSNSLRSFLHSPEVPQPRLAKVVRIRQCTSATLVSLPLTDQQFAQNNPAAPGAFMAPDFLSKWGLSADTLKRVRHACNLPADGTILIGDTFLEKEWAAADRLARFIPADQFFVNTP